MLVITAEHLKVNLVPQKILQRPVKTRLRQGKCLLILVARYFIQKLTI